MPDDIVQLTHVGRVFAGPPSVEALRDATFAVARGEHVAVRGPSGSGKSTLLNVVGLLDHPTTGSYALGGVDTASLRQRDRTRARRDSIGFVFQDFYLMAGRTAVENVALGLVYAGVPAARRRTLAASALDRVGLAHRRDALPTTLSGGERQRVAIARALVHQPLLLLCDEPTGNLDSATATQVMSVIAALHDDGMTVLTITHDPATAAWASRQLTMADGVVEQRG